MNANQSFSEQPEVNIDLLTGEADTSTPDTPKNNELGKLAMGALIGATLGTVAAALTIKGTTEKVDKTVKSVGNAVKGATGSFNQTVKDVGNAINTIADSVNETVKDVGDAVKHTALDINGTAINTVDGLKGTAVGINDTVKNTVDVVKGAAEGVKDTVKDTVDTAKSTVEDDTPPVTHSSNMPNNQTTYILVPLDKKQ